MKAAQIAYVILTVLFLLASMVLLINGKAILAAVVFLLVSVFGFVVFTTMLMNDAGMSKPRE